MSIGATARRLLGPFEVSASRAFRSLFFRIEEFGELLARSSQPERILEIGCGDGLLAEELAQRFAHASITGIDIDAEPGRLFAAKRTDQVRFYTCAAPEFTREHPGEFDLVVLCDVLHHVESGARSEILSAAGRALDRGGLLIVKEWEALPTLWTGITGVIERRISGSYTRYETAPH